MKMPAIRNWGSREHLLFAFALLLAAFAAFVVMVQAWLVADGLIASEYRQRLGQHAQTMHQLERGLLETSDSLHRLVRDPSEHHRAQHEAQVDLWRRSLALYEAQVKNEDVVRDIAIARAAADRYFSEAVRKLGGPATLPAAATTQELQAEALGALRRAGEADQEARRNALGAMERVRKRAANGISMCGAFILLSLLLVGLLTRAQARQHEQAQRWAEDAVRGMLARAEEANEELREELAVARRDLREADAARLRKDAFLGVLGHELRNPLAPLANAQQILAKLDPSHPGYARATEIMGRQIRHLSRLVDDLLDVTRIANGKMALHTGRVDLAELVREALNDHDEAIAKHRIQLVANLPGTPVMVDGDAARLRQVVGNLVGNAIKFTPSDGWILVMVEKTRDGSAELRVADTGIGIDPELMPRLFDPFAQGASRPECANTGLGLGLPLAKALVELHGGRLQARSDGPRLGAEFVVRLPPAAGPCGADDVPADMDAATPLLDAAGGAMDPEQRFFDAMRRAANQPPPGGL